MIIFLKKIVEKKDHLKLVALPGQGLDVSLSISTQRRATWAESSCEIFATYYRPNLVAGGKYYKVPGAICDVKAHNVFIFPI